MKLSRISNSIITRLILLFIVIATVGVFTRLPVLTSFLREDLEKVASVQQLALANYVAQEIDQKIVARQAFLKQIAITLPLAMLQQPIELRAWLSERYKFQPFFTEGLFITDLNGIALSDYPHRVEREQINYLEDDFMRDALAGKASIGRATMSRISNLPTLPMSEPVRDVTGQIRAVLVGVTTLAAEGFLELLQTTRIGETGGFLLISPRDQIFVAATRPELILKPTPLAGVNALHDRALAGFRGAGVTLNAEGIEELSAIASVPAAGWFVVARLPTAEAFSVIARMRHFVIDRAITLIPIFLLLTATGLYFVFRPLLQVADHADRMTLGIIPLAPLPVARTDEVGYLTEAFNRLLKKLQKNEALLKEAQAIAGLGNFILDIKSGQWEGSEIIDKLFGIDDTYDHSIDGWIGLLHPANRSMMIDYLNNEVIAQGRSFDREYRIIRRSDQLERWVHNLGKLDFDAEGRPVSMHGTIQDITERKLTEVALRIAAEAFESHEAMIITDANSVILRINRAFSEASGYSAEEVIGQTPRIFKSGRHSKEFYVQMWESIQRIGSWRGEIWDRRKNGEIYPKWSTITAVKSEEGTVTHYVAVHTDITERKAAEEVIKNMAFYDPLTQLSNRRLLNDHLRQAMVTSKRSGRHGALLFLDVDKFKTLNDGYGHVVGDLLLIEVADRLKKCVREMDAVARFGGDEFVVLLNDLAEDEATSAAQVESIAEKIRSSLSQTYLLATEEDGVAGPTVEHHSAASIGVALFKGHDISQDEILKRADNAMYQAKNDGRNLIRFYNPEA
ncbi:MAG: diguanylate cyclase [Gammaproteobacteria bacterium]|nr:diguanylate cyclase [Gammaproteobacteria bacterium]MBL7000576.1 diguanylate cyclase [Gammaproteobacteria bacterium]